MDGHCIDCGKPSVGLRCTHCHGAFMAKAGLDSTAEADEALLASAVGKSAAQLAREWGVSRTRVAQKLTKAKERQAKRSALA